MGQKARGGLVNQVGRHQVHRAANRADQQRLLARRQVEAFGRPGDIFFGISTSGNSKNVILAAGQAKASGLRTIGLLGNNGGQLKNECDIALTVPSSVTARIQEVHITIIHMLCEKIVPELK